MAHLQAIEIGLLFCVFKLRPVGVELLLFCVSKFTGPRKTAL